MTLGQTVWVHADDASQIDVLVAIHNRMSEDADAPEFVITGTEAARVAANRAGFADATIGAGTKAETLDFLHHWSPSVLLWMSETVATPFLGEVQKAGVPALYLLEGQKLPMAGWVPGRLKARLTAFHRILTTSTTTTARIQRLGLANAETLGSFRDTLPPPADMSSDHQTMTQAIGVRPVWLALDVPETEIAALLATHRRASRRSHRLLLVLAPQDAQAHDATLNALEQSSLSHLDSRTGNAPDEVHQVFVLDPSEASGLWLRLAPITFFGGTLSRRNTADPMQAALLGSVVVHGMKSDHHHKTYQTLMRAQASCPVRNAQELSDTIERLLAPDIAAEVAAAAWQVSTEGANATNRIIDLIRDLRDGIA